MQRLEGREGASPRGRGGGEPSGGRDHVTHWSQKEEARLPGGGSRGSAVPPEVRSTGSQAGALVAAHRVVPGGHSQGLWHL